jgi:hypothetical protein
LARCHNIDETPSQVSYELEIIIIYKIYSSPRNPQAVLKVRLETTSVVKQVTERRIGWSIPGVFFLSMISMFSLN